MTQLIKLGSCKLNMNVLSMQAQVVQVSTCARESFGCVRMLIEIFYFACFNITS